MNIVIVSGGSGSKSIQRAIYDNFEKTASKESYDVKVLVNAYDNGLSTGLVRKVADGKILGPSDVRKNQMLRYSLEKRDDPNYESVKELMSHRFYSSRSDAENYIMDFLFSYGSCLKDWQLSILLRASNTYFKQELSKLVDYTDFSLSNIIYAGLAIQNNNSLRMAASVMAGFLGIKDNVILNSDESLYLKAITECGNILYDEADIVSYNNYNDKIVDCDFYPYFPTLNDEASNSLWNADLIVLSSGTQWSSLIPTYRSIGFKEIIEEKIKEDKVIMVMNNEADTDSPSMTNKELFTYLNDKCFSTKDINVIYNTAGYSLMNVFSFLDKDKSLLSEDKLFYFTDNNKIHSSESLYKTISQVCKKKYEKKQLIFDYDDTLVARDNKELETSLENVELLNKVHNKDVNPCFVCTGNNINNISKRIKNITIFADGGVIPYSFTDGNRYSYLAENNEYIFTPNQVDNIFDILLSSGIPYHLIENRGNAVIAIKPLKDRDKFTNDYLHLPNNIVINKVGRNTLEIRKSSTGKQIHVNLLLTYEDQNIVYFGDDPEGNDKEIFEIKHKNLTCIKVDNVGQVNFLLKTLVA